MNKKFKKENRKIFVTIISIVLLICVLTSATFSYLVYKSEYEIQFYQAYCSLNNALSFTKDINVLKPDSVNSIIASTLYDDSINESLYISIENDYYNFSIDNANKIALETDYTNLSYVVYSTLRESMTDEQYEKICSYLNSKPDENGNYYILSINEYALDNYDEISTGEIIPIKLEILLTNDNHSWYVEDEHIEYFELSSEKIDKIKEQEKASEKRLEENNIEDLAGKFGEIYHIGEMRRNEIPKDFFINGGKENEIKKIAEENPIEPEEVTENVYLGDFTYLYGMNRNETVFPADVELTAEETEQYKNKTCSISAFTKVELLKACASILIIGNSVIFAFFVIIGTILILVVWKSFKNRSIREQYRIDMTNAIAHNLKTPLCVINGFSENLREDEDYITKLHYIDIIQEQTSDMDVLVHKMIDFSKLDSLSVKFNKKAFNVKLELEKLVDKYSKITDKNIILKADNREITVDRELMEIVFENLIENAIKYSNDSDIEIVFIDNHFSISNGSEEISKKELKTIWKPYNRLTKDEEERGTGIGLAIVKHILKLHKYRPVTEYSQGRFSISFCHK